MLGVPKNLDNFTSFSEELTGIRKRTLENCETWETVWQQFAKFTRYTKYRLGSWGAYADMEFLKNTYKQYNIRCNHHRTPLCVMSFVKGVLCERGVHVNGFGLKAICSHLDVPKPSHRAMDDTEAMLGVLKKLMFEEKSEGFSLIEI
jgi:DNA polymerase III epsilon subunit-like protein